MPLPGTLVTGDQHLPRTFHVQPGHWRPADSDARRGGRGCGRRGGMGWLLPARGSPRTRASISSIPAERPGRRPNDVRMAVLVPAAGAPRRCPRGAFGKIACATPPDAYFPAPIPVPCHSRSRALGPLRSRPVCFCSPRSHAWALPRHPDRRLSHSALGRPRNTPRRFTWNLLVSEASMSLRWGARCIDRRAYPSSRPDRPLARSTPLSSDGPADLGRMQRCSSPGPGPTRIPCGLSARPGCRFHVEHRRPCRCRAGTVPDCHRESGEASRLRVCTSQDSTSEEPLCGPPAAYARTARKPDPQPAPGPGRARRATSSAPGQTRRTF